MALTAPKTEISILRKCIIQLPSCPTIATDSRCKQGHPSLSVSLSRLQTTQRQDQCFVFHHLPSALHSACLGKSKGTLSTKVSLQSRPKEEKPLFCTSASNPQLPVVRANLHLSISESSAFSYSICFLVS